MKEQYTFTIAVFLFAALFFTGAGLAENEDEAPVNWVTKYDLARHMGTESERPVLLFVTTESCKFCQQMQDESFSNQSIVQEIRKSFVPAKLYLEPDSKLAKALKVTIYPTTVIISPDGKIVEYARGYLSTDELVERMDKAVVDVQRGLAPDEVAVNQDKQSR